MKRTSPLRMLMDVYTQRQSYHPDALRFMFDGNLIGFGRHLGSQTPDDVRLMSGHLPSSTALSG
jgi:hypothetical protein